MLNANVYGYSGIWPVDFSLQEEINILTITIEEML